MQEKEGQRVRAEKPSKFRPIQLEAGPSGLEVISLQKVDSLLSLDVTGS
jgi:hypothetical protein